MDNEPAIGDESAARGFPRPGQRSDSVGGQVADRHDANEAPPAAAGTAPTPPQHDAPAVPARPAAATAVLPSTDTIRLSEPLAVRDALTVAPAAAAPLAGTAAISSVPTASVTSGGALCLSCLGLRAPSIAQGVTTVINHMFNNAFDWLSTFPANPISDFVEGSLLLIRRSVLGFVPTGVSASQTGNSLLISVNTGSVAYFRTTGTTIEIAGDPGFTKAQQFAARSVTDVVAHGNGNAGCAGFVFTEGSAASDLRTFGIDSLRFQSDTAFAGTVTAESVPAALTVRDAVRGLHGVTLNGPVILAGDAEVDAGSGDAIFAGTVDGHGWFGGQSLTVTALGNTTFDRNVGARKPLGSLTTRAIEPLKIDQSADSTTIPLHYVAVGDSLRYGIDVAIGDNKPRMYLFDTGGNGFFAGYDPAYFSGVPLGTDPVQISYTSGQTLLGLATPANITIGTGSHSVSTRQPVDLAAVVSATTGAGGGPGSGTQPPPADVNAPFSGFPSFAGDFGAAFGVESTTGQQPYDNGPFIASPLFQLPGNLSSGYLVQLGPIGTTPQLTVGVTDALRSQFPYAVPASVMTDSKGEPAGFYPYTNHPLLDQFGFSPTYSVSQGSDTPAILGDGPLPTLIDSGAGSTSARLPDPLVKPYMDAKTGELKPGTQFRAVFPTAEGIPALDWRFTAGGIPSVNKVGYMNSTGAATDVPNVNTGLNLFNDFDVMYDVANKVIWLRPNGGQSTVSLKSVTTKGAQSYGQNAELDGTYTTGDDFSVGGLTTLMGNTVVDTGCGDATFSGTVDAATAGAQSLQVNSRGTTTFARPVGGDSALAALTTDRHGATVTDQVQTTGAQSYQDDVTLNGAYTTQSGGFLAAKSTTIAGPLTSVSTASAPITFGGDVQSTPGAGNVLTVSASNNTVTFTGTVGSSKDPLGGLNLGGLNSGGPAPGTVTGAGPVYLSGGQTNSQGSGLVIGDGVTATFEHGGAITNFSGSGVLFNGSSPSSVLKGFDISGNVAEGIQFAGGNYSGTVISGNTIGAMGDTNQWGYQSNGPNAQGIVLAPGTYTGVVIFNNTIQYNRRDGITAPDGVQGLTISGNTLRYNEGNGIEFTGGDFSGTIVSGNTITANGADGIILGAGIGQALKDYGDPKNGYRDKDLNDPTDLNPYRSGHYLLPFSNPKQADFYSQDTAQPTVAVTFGGASEPVQLALDTGSRGLFITRDTAPGLGASAGTPGYIYLNSSNRMFFGDWVDTTIAFPEATWMGPGTPKLATADVPVLLVSAVGASMVPEPGSTTAIATFATKKAQGTVEITNGSQTTSVPIIGNTGGKEGGTVTIPGGWWATFADNDGVFAPVSNFGVGFERSGLGAVPTENGFNQAANAFLNLSEMRDGTMRPGYVVTPTGVMLGLDSTVDGYAYTDLAPTGLSRGTQTAPDWQSSTGRFTYQPTAGSTNTQSATGPVSIDLGISTGILTLPNYSATASFTGQLTVDLLNSGGLVSYTVNPADAATPWTATTNLMSATAVKFFAPLAGAYSQNMPPLNQQFFNTGRRVIAGMNYLYDAAGGYLGLYTPNDGSNQAEAFASADGKFTAAHYPNPSLPGGVKNLSIQNNVINGNGRNGITVNGTSSINNPMSGNVMFDNKSGNGIALTNGGNGGQPAPVIMTATLNGSSILVTGSAQGTDGYTGPFQVQVFASPATDAGKVEGRVFLGTVSSPTQRFTAQFPSGTIRSGDWITVIATPAAPGVANNTSPFSAPMAVAR